MKESFLRRCVAELIGTFAIVFFGCGSIISLQGRTDQHFMVNTVFGLVVAASIYALGHVSAAHFNPAVTIAFASIKQFPTKEIPGYVLAQCTGAVLASALHSAILGPKALESIYGATKPSNGVSGSFIVELFITAFLMLVIVSVATDKRVHRAIPGLAIGITVLLCGLFAGPLSGCSMNPARSLGPALFASGEPLSSLWIYILAPVLGAVGGANLYRWISHE